MKLVISIIVIAIMLIVFIAVRLSENVNVTHRMVTHTRDIVVQTQELLQAAFDNESGSRAYVITGDKRFLEPFQNSEKDFSVHLEKLSVLVAEDPVEKNLTDSLRFYFAKRALLTNEMLLLRNRGDIRATTALVAAGNGLIYGNKIRFFGNEIIRIENELLDKRQLNRDNTLDQLKGVLYGMIALAFLLSIGFLLIIQKDISKQEKLRNEINELALMMEESSEAIFARGPELILTRWNKGAEKLFGYSKAEAIGKNPLEVGFIKISVEEIKLIENQVLQQGFSKTDRVFYHKNGSRFFGSVTANMIKDEAGKVLSFYFIVKDISMHKELQSALQLNNAALEEEVKARTEVIIKNESRFRSLVENNYDIIALLDRSLKTIYRSPSATRTLGWTDDEMSKMEGMDNIHPDDREYVETIMKFAVNHPGEKVEALLRRKHKSGHYLWLQGTITNMLHDPVMQAYVTNFRDVTEKLVAEKKLVSSEKRFRALLENNYDIISLMDESFNVVYRSPSAARIMGWTDEEMKNTSGIKNIHPDDLAYARGIVQELMANPGKSVNTLFRNRHKLGHYLWMEGTVTNLLHDESVKAILFNFRDVTERIAATDKLASSEKRFRALLENNNDIISLMDESFGIIYRSPSALRITGWTDEEMKNISGIRNIHPDDQAYARGVVQELMANPGKSITTSFRNLHKQGHYLWVEGTLTNLLHDENIKAIVFNFRDVTERITAAEKLAKSELLFRSLIENISEGISMTDEKLNPIFRSPSAMRLLGEMGSKRGAELVHPDDRETIIGKQAESLNNPGVVVPFEGRFLIKDGEYAWIEGEIINMLHLEGVNAIVSNYRDVTIRKNAEQKLHELNLNLEDKIEQRTTQLKKAN